ncbi:ABC transporter substrate-binding protein [Rhizobium sp. KVB221]|uniref:ABC transporter substrate-binding protein n=1 Tax=Rhizobium setariae TaxID=2801340 RepID=A0A937CMU5_9HYPH|nr:extracellular solute-binding protein [Rhizobium setariae]MBL0370403.1 ABC transporter substrate-binding protein [Rhizobium setariae]
MSGKLARLPGAILALSLVLPAAALAQSWTNGISTIGQLKYPPGFEHFDYVNPDAPKGGDLHLSELGTFDTLNPIPNKGNIVASVGIVYETLMKPSSDEVFSSYGLLAESISYPPDFSSVSFRMNPKARWADGQPVTVDDVIFSFEKSRELDPSKASYYSHVTKAEKIGDAEVKFTFDQKDNRELPNIVGQLLVVPKHWWEGTDARGKKRNVAATTLEPVMGSGPYKIVSVKPGSTIKYQLRDDYWGTDLPVNVGQNNFRTIDYTYFSDRNVEFEAFRGGNVDYWAENQAKRWATQYGFPAVKQGKVKKELFDNEYRRSGVMVGFIPNLRREKFKDARVREALNYCFDFEELNRTIFYNNYQRVNSYFFGSELASSGLPQGKELAILEGMRDEVPPSVFTQEYKSPVSGDQKKLRENLRQAVGLFKQAGYEIRGNKMVNTKTGEPFAFEIMLNTPIIEPVALAFANNLKLIGVKASVRSVDDSQFTERGRNRDFDVMYNGWEESLNPGNEQAEYWGSKSAETEGTRNWAGISDPAIDKLVKMVIFSPVREDQIAAVKALDRVLLHHHYVVPSYTLRKSRIAYWDRFERPKELPYYSIGFPTIWWAKR